MAAGKRRKNCNRKNPLFSPWYRWAYGFAGSAYENINDNGMSHFIEHILFKGTKRIAKEIARAMDSVGGQLNAFTAKENRYYSNVMDKHLALALDILSDMVLNSVMDPGDIERKGVIPRNTYV